MNAVRLSSAIAGDGPARESVWLVDVLLPTGGTSCPLPDDGVFDDEEQAEDAAAALAAELGLPISDERPHDPPAPGGDRPCRPDLGDAA